MRETLGYLPQSFGFHPRVSAERLLDHFAVLKGLVEPGARRDVVESLLRQTNLWDVRKQRVGTFSGGMRQRLGVAVALLGNPKLIIVDEPTAGLDPEERVRFLNLLSEIGEDSVVILSTHIVEDVEELCSRMAIIDRGEILLEAEPLRAIDELRGRIWRRTVSREELPALETELPVISTKLLAGRTIVHVYAEASPGAAFEPVEPDLKDVYFSVMAGHPAARARRSGGGVVRLREVFRYEFEYRLRSASTWVYAGFLFLRRALDLACRRRRRGPGIHVNAPQRLAGGFVRSAGCSACWSRRRSSAMPPSATSRPEWIRSSSRRRSARPNTSAAASSARWRSTRILVVAIPLGLLATTWLLASIGRRRSARSASRRTCSRCCSSSCRTSSLVGAILFTIGVLTRQVHPGLPRRDRHLHRLPRRRELLERIDEPDCSPRWPTRSGSRRWRDMTAVLDGGRAEHAADRIPAMLVWNRALWLAIAAAVLAVLHRTFRFAHA